MSDPTTESARDDLAFVRALVSEGGQAQATLGEALFGAGLCYGIQCALQFLFASGVYGAPLVQLAVGVLPTVVFTVLMVRITVRDRGQSQHGVSTRAINATFGGAGLAAICSAAIFGYLSMRANSMETFLLHPVIICVLQGTVWYTAFVIRRRGWFGLVSAGWFATSLALAFVLGTHDPRLATWFLGVLTLAMFLLLALPGWLLWKGAARG